ncbi:Phage-related protein, predicted endonuclease [Planctomicrobium piriforme]|uniref:Phage-related protein, predicted endonuclease n=2 Tax=Planctomicrobium piriforme TaxID=1576369 RepID=A0A1I3EIF1_9PLAN|nr:Phage-related protein, predicted endonuclease [Planctomicrobium piriforme]
MACGVDPHCSTLQGYMEARGELPPFEPSEEQKERMSNGLEIEPYVLRLYSKKMKCQVEPNSTMYFHPNHWWMGATQDGRGYRTEPEPEEWTVESKNAGYRMFDKTGTDDSKYGEDGTDQVPLTVLYQCQHQMAVMGTERADVPVFTDNRLRIYTVPRSDELIATIIEAEKELAERIVNGDPPPPDYTHAGTRKLLTSMYGCVVGSKIELGLDLKNAWLEREEISLQLKALEDRKDEITNALLDAIGMHELATFSESDIRVNRITVKDSLVTQKQVDELAARIGQVGRKGSVRLLRVKGK